ncbi:uncharacterized protein SAPINGB_P004087 [Magnusiomyces paraingens]|uniref:Peroxin-3 n=1 Tax=Magnusiomyces paraingens TaxID=2606893 RepID=A0A5E8BTP2_9ASCO|nr:uncharacterized protein SAPINGB_P004087 [Saprochaete ingens]VVT54461.1 unnamed protein product [Saprochaete ingens]
MTIVSSVGTFLKRHRRKLLVSAGIVASGYLAIDYLKNKFFELQDRLASERTAKENLRRRFDQNQEDATFTIMALLPGLSADIIDAYPVESITQQLQQKRSAASRSVVSAEGAPSETGSESVAGAMAPTTTTVEGEASAVLVETRPRASKSQLWQELKIEAIARLFTLIYSTALLVFLTRVQLNILGRKNYVVSVIELADSRRPTGGSGESSSDGEVEEDADERAEREAATNRLYLMFSWWLLNRGWLVLKEQVTTAVERVFGPINPRADLTLEKLSELIGQVQYLIDYPFDSTVAQNFLHNLIPPEELETYVLAQAQQDPSAETEELAPGLRELLDETADLVESPNAGEVIKRLVHTGLSISVSKISQLYPVEEVKEEDEEEEKKLEEKEEEEKENDEDEKEENRKEISPATVKLASILANISKQAHGVGAGTPLEPSEYVTAMANVPDLNAFSAVVYSNFDWRELDSK